VMAVKASRLSESLPLVSSVSMKNLYKSSAKLCLSKRIFWWILSALRLKLNINLQAAPLRGNSLVLERQSEMNWTNLGSRITISRAYWENSVIAAKQVATSKARQGLVPLGCSCWVSNISSMRPASY
jgi:hypothetical protein